MEDEALEINLTFDRVCNVFKNFSKMICEVSDDNLYDIVLRLDDSVRDTPEIFVLSYAQRDLLLTKKKAIIDAPLKLSRWSDCYVTSRYPPYPTLGNELRYSTASKILASLKNCKTLSEMNLELDMMGI